MGTTSKTIHSAGEEDTARAAAALADEAAPGTIIALSGPMGAGKSVFARGFIRALCGPDTEVPSPTFTLVQPYDSPKGPVYHFDLYRLEAPEEVLALNWDEALKDGICLIEWPEKAGTLLKEPTINIEINIKNQTDRDIKIKGTV